jgi:uncharacterized membrane protein YgcG
MTAFLNRATLTTAVSLLFGFGFAFAQTPKDDAEKKKDEPPTKEELELRKGSRDLAYKFIAGEEYHCEARQKRVEKKAVQGKTRTDTRELDLKLVLTSSKIHPDGGAEFTGRVDHVKYTRIGPTGVRKFDSRRSENPEGASDGWELYVDARFTFKVDTHGKVSGIRPDAATAEFWNQQHRDLKALVANDVIESFLPFVPLPADLVRRGTDWKETRKILDQGMGAREVVITFGYRGSETISGRPYEEVRLRAEAKQTDAKPKFEIVEHRANGKLSFDKVRGNMHDFRFNESYVFNPPDAELVLLPDPDEDKKEKKEKKSGGPGMRGPGGSGGGGYPGGGSSGLSGGSSGRGQKKKKDDKDDEEPVSKIVMVDLENEVRLMYRGKPIASD